MIKLFILCLFWLYHPLAVHALEPSALVLKANESFSAGRFKEAVQYYEQALSAGLDNGHLYYNLGNAYFRLGELGKAIASYRLAEGALPRNPDLISNLALARKKTVDRLEEETAGLESFFLSKLLLPRSWFSREELQLAFLCCYASFWFGMAAFFVFDRASIKMFCGIGLVGSCYLGLLIFGTQPLPRGNYRLTLSFPFPTPAVVVITAAEAKAYSGDSENYQAVFVLHDGAELSYGEERGDWVKIILPLERQGWVKKENVKIL